MKKSTKLLFLGSISIPFTSLFLSSKCFAKNVAPKQNDLHIINPFIKMLTTDESNEMIQANKNNKDFVLLDVREPGEINEQYIKGMINIDFNNSNFEEEIRKLNKDKTYLVYCRTQNRSHKAAKFMFNFGFKYVYWMNGGITQWLREGKPVIETKTSNRDLFITAKNNIFTNFNEVKFNISSNNIDNVGQSFKYSFTIYDKDKNILKNKELFKESNFEVLLGEIIADFMIENDKTYTLEVQNQNDINKTKALFSFQISSTKKNKDYDFYTSKKAYEHFTIQNSHEVNSKFIKENFHKNLLQYQAFDENQNIKRLFQNIDLNKKTIVVFGSTTCLSCLETFKHFAKFDLSKFNYIKILTSIDKDNLARSINNAKNVFDNNGLTSEFNNVLFDGYDLIWKNKLRFETTPKILLLDEFGQIVNASETIENNFLLGMQNIVNKTFDILLEIKTLVPPNILPNPPINPKPKPNGKQQTFQDRINNGDFNGFTDILININKKIYATNLNDLEVSKSDGSTMKLKEVFPKNNKPTIVIYGQIRCAGCANVMRYFKGRDWSNYNMLELLNSYGTNSIDEWKRFITNNGDISKLDKNIFKPTSSWNLLIKHFKYVPQIFILDSENNLTYAIFSKYLMAEDYVNRVKDTLSIK